MTDPFRAARRQIEKAKKHIKNLERDLLVYINSTPGKKVIESDANGIEYLHKLRLIRPIPDSLADEAEAAVNLLRSSLDHAGRVVAVTTGKADPHNATFPFGDDATYLKGQGGSKDLPPEMFAYMRSFKPYKGGNDLLYAVNKACNTNKHDFLVPMAIAGGGTGIRDFYAPPGVGFALPNPVWDRTKNEIVYLRTFILGPQPQYDMRITVYVVFDEIQGIAGQEPVTALENMTSVVERVFAGIEAESRRLGFTK